MAEPVRIAFQWTADDLMLARRSHWRYICRPAYRRSVHLFLAFIAGLSIYSLSVAGPSPVPIVFLVLLLYIYIGRPYERRWHIRRVFAKRPDKNADLEWLISSDKLCFKGPRSKAEFLWTAFTKVIQTQDGFLFYPIDEIFHFLPKRGFQNDTDVQRLTQLAQEHASKFIRMS
jgi:hypothetical protein